MASSAVSADAELLAAVDSFFGVTQECHRREDEISALHDAWKARHPIAETLRYTEADRRLGLPKPAAIDRQSYLFSYDLTNLREARRGRVDRGVIDNLPFRAVCNGIADHYYIPPDAATIARIDEIVAAYEGWAGRVEKNKPDTDALTNENWDRQRAAHEEVLSFIAATPEGLRAKLRVLKHYLLNELPASPRPDQPLTHLDTEELMGLVDSPESELLWSLACDIEASLATVA